MIVNGDILKCYLKRCMANKLRKAEGIGRLNVDMVVGGDMLLCGTTILLAGAFAYVGLGNCNCLGHLELEKLRALNGLWAREVLNAATYL
jgi:hypothetical protein